LGAGGPRFESGRPDQKYLPYFLQLIKRFFTPNFTVEFRQTGGRVPQMIQLRRLVAFGKFDNKKDRRANS